MEKIERVITFQSHGTLGGFTIRREDVSALCINNNDHKSNPITALQGVISKSFWMVWINVCVQSIAHEDYRAKSRALNTTPGSQAKFD